MKNILLSFVFFSLWTALNACQTSEPAKEEQTNTPPKSEVPKPMQAKDSAGNPGTAPADSNKKQEKGDEPSTQKATPAAKRPAFSAASLDCAHCGMPSDDFPAWNGRLTTDTKTEWLCSPKCTFTHILDEKTRPENIEWIELTDYYSSEKIDAQQAFFVIQSDMAGPMGADLVPFKDRNAAQEFMEDHQGEQILTFEQVNKMILGNLKRKKKQ